MPPSIHQPVECAVPSAKFHRSNLSAYPYYRSLKSWLFPIRRALALCAFAISHFYIPQALAQAPNDNFTNAWLLCSVPCPMATTNGSNTGTSKETGEPNHAGNQGGRSVWFNWTAPVSSLVQIHTVGSSFNTLLAVYTGTNVNALTVLAANNDFPNLPGGASLVQFIASAGTTYRIVVDAFRAGGFFPPAGGQYVLTLETVAAAAITSPAEGALFLSGDPVTVVADTHITNGPPARVEFYHQGNLFQSLTAPPFTATTTNTVPGSNSFFVVSLHESGFALTSAVVRVAVANPGITIMSPNDGATFLNTNPITVVAIGLLPSGTVTNIQFFVDGQKFAEDSSAPFSAVWSPVLAGSHRLTAVGKDDSGNTHFAAPVNIAVARVLVARRSTWRYLANGVDQGTNWYLPGFDDSSWSSGRAEFGYGDGDETTVVNALTRYVTVYFRHAFTVTNAARYTNILMNVRRDDGAVVYLNGTEVSRFNMPTGEIAFSTFALLAQDDGTLFHPGSAPASFLVEGTNVLAVEIHQDRTNSTDSSFEMDLTGVPMVIRNDFPVVALTNPTSGMTFLGPSEILLQATASDTDGSVAKVEFFSGNTKIGEDTSEPYSFPWASPPLGPHTLFALATDNENAVARSTGVNITVYDAAGTPFARVTAPPDGTVVEGPTNMVVTAFASALDGVTNVQFFANGALIGNDPASPYSVVWNAPFGSNTLTAVAFGADGRAGTSEVVHVTITIPPTNTVAPTIASQNPLAGATRTNLTSIQITFSERVLNVDASDLLINGVPAAQLSGSGSNYTFTFPQPAYGLVAITWAADHGITDIGFPANLPFDQNAPGATWSYDLIDRIPPVLTSRIPAPNSTVSNLTQVSVTFSEAVSGVNAADLLVNGSGAIGLAGGGSNYVFSFPQPPAGPVTISWATTHGIADLAASPNAFNAAAAGWNVTLDNRTILVQSNSAWLFFKGTNEASNPIDAWRQPVFDDSSWSNALAPFFFGDPYNTPGNPGTQLTDMQGGYTSIYLRRKFYLPNAALATNLFLLGQIDDGMIVWINGVEVFRVNMPLGDVPYDATASTTANEPNQSGAAYIVYPLPDPRGYLVDGTNTLAVHAFNQSLTQSTDFGFNGQLFTFLLDVTTVPPRITGVNPPPGELYYLTNITVAFSEPVTGVDASDFQINGVSASTVETTTNTVYTFRFPQPAFGPVTITWASGHGIADFDSPSKPFEESAPGSSFQYSLINPSAPTIASQTPLAGATITHQPSTPFTELSVTFSEPVAGVNAPDLLVSGIPASGVSGSGANYTFTFAQPPYGAVAIGWAANHGIEDVESPANGFDGTRAGNRWSYTLVDQVAPVISSVTPPGGSPVTNLTQVIVSFSEPVTNVNASDLRINGVAASSVAGGPAVYTFSFPQPNATLINFTWVNNHGIRDLAPVPNSFDATAPGATWSYTTSDTLAPSVANIDPPPFVTVRSLLQIRVTFSEPVGGVDTNDLLVNNAAALSVRGSGAGPYTFTFLPPTNGVVDVRWALAHGITDFATPTPNPFGGGEWTYVLDPDATFAGKVLINEIMFNPLGGRPNEEWLELRNLTASPISLAGWRFTRGIDFTFPNVSIAPNGYLVVAANVEAFQARYPDVVAPGALVGGWMGRLANSDEDIEFETALGEVVDTVHYATHGDWARRERGGGAELVGSIVRNGNTATVTIFAHGYTAGGGFGGGADQVLISGADQPEYNGVFTIAGVTPTTFNITVSGSPASPAAGHILCRHVEDDTFTGWSWFSAADGFGSSLELVNPLLPNSAGQNWLTSTNIGGTPGAANSVAANNVAPLILDASHFPAVPRSSNTVSISARIVDELVSGPTNVTLFYRNHTTTAPGAFNSTNMFDDGAHGDALSADGLFGAVLPPAANGAVIEFYIQATDATGLSRTWPAPTWNTNNTFGQLANGLYQVDDEIVGNSMPVIRIVLSGTERAIFPPNDRDTDAEMNNTFISTDGDGTKIRYLAGARVRGAGSRTRTPPNNRINIPNDNRWNGLAAVNMNGQFVHAQIMGAAVARKAGVPASEARIVQYRINGINPAPITAPFNGGNNGAGYGAFILVEPVNGDLAQNMFPEDGDGNVYRASTGQHAAQLNYQGTNPAGYLGIGYFKTSNQTQNDWSDLINLTAAFGNTGPLPEYLEAMSTNVNVEVWMRYFALGTLINYGETSLFNGRGDDYALYRGVIDPRFVPIGHDFDTVFGQGDTVDIPPGTGYYPIRTNASLFIMLNPPNTGGGGFGGNPPNITLLRRFLTNEVFAPIFFAEVKRLAETVFDPAELNPLFDQLLTWNNGPTLTTINDMKNYAANRRANALAQIPLTLTARSALTSSNGYPYTTVSTVTLSGNSHAINTRKVLVNGNESIWSPWEAAWTNSVVLQPGINRVLVQSLDSNNVEFARITMDIWYDDGSVTSVSGALATDTFWTAANGPYQVTANLTVNAGITLAIQPGTTVYLGPGVNITVANGGRLLAEGTDTARIRFANTPGGPQWGGITVNGGPASPETRIAYAHFEGNSDTAIHSVDGTVFLDHLTFGNTAEQYVSLDRSSFVVQNCVFPSATTTFELVHGDGGIKAGGRGIFLRNFFGKAIGFNDVVDFTGGNRPGPIVQFINNVFNGSDDDLLDLDGTDAWIEGNIFLHVHRNNSPDSASAVSGGVGGGVTSEITVIGNLFYDVDQAANAKEGNFYTFVNNTIVHQTRIGSQDTNTAVVILADEGTAQGAGVYLEGNIIYDAENLVRNVTTAIVTYTNNIIYQLQGAPWTGPGGDNLNVDPLLKRIPPFSETTNYNSWAAAQVMWDYFSLQDGSPAKGTGPNGRDKGGVIPLGVSISGEPVGYTPLNSAVLRVGINRTGNGIPASGFPNGSGFTVYRWRLDGGAWSAEVPLANPIILSGLSSGSHYVEVIGARDCGFYQDDPIYGPDAIITVSRTWTVEPNTSPLHINEVLASNSGAVNHHGTTPDVIELYNSSDTALDLTGVRISDDGTDPDKFIFPPGSSIPPRGYLLVYANDPDGTPGYHLGFNLNQQGDVLYLFAAVGGGGVLLDGVDFGMQLTDLSIGRAADGSWALTEPTLGSANRIARLGDPRALRINEWLALGSSSDFIEIHNTAALPVSLGGLYLSDEVLGWPNRHQIAALSFIEGYGYVRFLADGDPVQGPEHVDFGLSGDQGTIGLFLPDFTPIDCIWYQAQQPNISQGRSPNGAGAIVFFNTPTPGAPNPLVGGPAPFGGALVINEVLALNASLVENGRTPDWAELYNGTTNDINLSNLSLTDNTLQPRRFVFPSGTTIASGGYLRVLCDTGATNQPLSGSTILNTNFALGSSGGGVYLFDTPANGGSLLSSIVYGIQTADLSIGRVANGTTNWVLTTPTPNAPNTPVPSLGNIMNLKVNEWMANPLSGENDWFEIYNPNSLPVAIGGLHLSDTTGNLKRHQIAALSFMGVGTNAWQVFVAGINDGQADHVSWGLSGSGEALSIATVDGALINGYEFGGQQINVSEGRFPDGSTNVVKFPGTASPGEANWRQLTQVAVNEVLTHTDEPLEDAIELHNLTSQPVDVGGWWLSDDNSTLQKYQIPSPTVIEAHSFVVIYENRFTNRELAAVPFALSSQGDEVSLSASSNNVLTGYRARVRFGAAANGVSFGRYITSDARAEFVAMSRNTFGIDDPANVEEFRQGGGATNAYPRVGPIIIAEVMYHPPDINNLDNVRDEYLELRNITTAPVQLFDPANPTNTWHLRDAVDFDFPTGVVISAGSSLLVVSFDPVNNAAALSAFRSLYNIDPSQPIVGPYDGRLANDNEDIELRRPGTPVDGDAPYILVERVRYDDSAPWPAAADGTGFSLHRVSDTGFANDPTNWVASAPAPGAQSSTEDYDHDGLPDWWENTNGFDRINPNDADFDTDLDGHKNLQEYRAGTNPRDASSVLRFTSIHFSRDDTNMLLTFRAMANHTYSILWKESADASTWKKLADVDAGAERMETAVDPLPPVMGRVYHLVTPQQPGPILPLPSIVSSPANVIAQMGGQASFNVVAVGNGPLTYQWLFNGSPIGGGGAGRLEAQYSTLTISNIQLSSLGLYSVTVTDANGSDTSRSAWLAVGPRIIIHPQPQSVPQGGTTTLSVAAEGAEPLSYRWLRKNGGRAQALAGETNSTLTLRNVQQSDAGQYSVLVSHQLPWGRFGTSSTAAQLTVQSRPITHIVHMSLDGLGSFYLQSYIAAAPSQFPNFVRLMTEGAYTFNARCDFDVSETIPNHACMLTGRPVLQPAGFPNTVHHGYNNNFPGAGDTFHISGNPNVPYKASFFDVAHDYGLTTAFYASKTRLAICDRSYNATNGAPDLVLPDNGRDKIDFASVLDLSGAAIAGEMDGVIANLTSTTPTNYSFVHLSEPDLTGHASGWRSANFSNAVRMVDAQLGRVFTAIANNPVLSNHTAFIVTADHGGGGVSANGHTEAFHITNYTIPFFLWGPRIPAGVDIYTLFSNRGDPGTNRADYSFDPQPLRNADGGNLGLALLGLQSIPGSFFVPLLNLPGFSPAVADHDHDSTIDHNHDSTTGGTVISPRLQIGLTENGYAISWPKEFSNYILEFSEQLAGPSALTPWQPVPAAFTIIGDRCVQVVTDSPAGARFYRLRKP